MLPIRVEGVLIARSIVAFRVNISMTKTNGRIDEMEKDNGWWGANHILFHTKDYEELSCDKCGKKMFDFKGEYDYTPFYTPLKMFHYIGLGRRLRNKHIAVCFECSQNLPSTWHGCGCGG